jgi:hypothetical protein
MRTEVFLLAVAIKLRRSAAIRSDAAAFQQQESAANSSEKSMFAWSLLDLDDRAFVTVGESGARSCCRNKRQQGDGPSGGSVLFQRVNTVLMKIATSSFHS